MGFMQHKKISVFLFFLSAGLSLNGWAAKLGMDREAYGVYDRTLAANVETYPFCVGQAYKPTWSAEVNPARNTFDWSELDERLELAYKQKQHFYLHVHLTYGKTNAPPAWIYDRGNIAQIFSTDGHVYPEYLNPEFQTYFSEMVYNLGDHLRNKVPSRLRGLISFVRVDCGVHGDDRPYDDGLLVPDAYRIDVESKEWLNFKFFVYETYKQAFQEGKGDAVPLLFKHASPLKYVAEWNWVQANINYSYGARYLGEVRGHHFTGSQITTDQFKALAVDSDFGLFSRNEMDMAWESGMAQHNLPLYFYWTAVEQLHPGLSIWDITGAALQETYNENFGFAFDFFNKWAAELVPATAGGGFCIFHEGLDASDLVKFPISYGSASLGNQARYEAICNDPVYAARGAKMDDPYAATKGQVYQHRNQTGYNDAGWKIVPGNYERFITQIDPAGTSIGLFRVNGPLTASSHPYDRFARSFESVSGKNTMYFDVNDDLLDSPTQPIKLSVIYLDRGKGSFELQYDAIDASNKTAFVVNKTGSNKWKTNSVVVMDGVFSNNGAKGADLMLLNVDEDDDVFHMLELIKLADLQVITNGHGTVQANHFGTALASANGTYMEGTRLDLTATAAQGWQFMDWTGKFSQTRGNWARIYPVEQTEIEATFKYTGYYRSIDDFESDTWTGGSLWEGDWTLRGGTTLTNIDNDVFVMLNSSGQLQRALSVSLNDAELSFDYDADQLNEGESARVEVFDGAWEEVWNVLDTEIGDDNGRLPDGVSTVTIDLSAYANISAVRFSLYASGTVDYLWLNNVKICGYKSGVKGTVPFFRTNPVIKEAAGQYVPYRATLTNDSFDADLDVSTYSKISGPDWLTVSPDGSLSGLPRAGDLGLNTFVVEVSDGVDGFSRATLLVDVSRGESELYFSADFTASKFQSGEIAQHNPVADPYGGIVNLNNGTSSGDWSSSNLEESSIWKNSDNNAVLFMGTGPYSVRANFARSAMLSQSIDIVLNAAICRTGTATNLRNYITGVDAIGRPVFKLWLSGNSADDGGQTLYIESANATNLLSSTVARYAQNTSCTDENLSLLEIGISNASIMITLDGTELTNNVPFYTADATTLVALIFEGDSMWYDNIEVAPGEGAVHSYNSWAAAHQLAGSLDDDDDHDGLSNLAEYAINGNPANSAKNGIAQLTVDASLFTFAFASNVVDHSLTYRLLSRTNLLEGITQTNRWQSQTIGPVDGDYIIVSNNFESSELESHFIQLQVEYAP